MPEARHGPSRPHHGPSRPRHGPRRPHARGRIVLPNPLSLPCPPPLPFPSLLRMRLLVRVKRLVTEPSCPAPSARLVHVEIVDGRPFEGSEEPCLLRMCLLVRVKRLVTEQCPSRPCRGCRWAAAVPAASPLSHPKGPIGPGPCVTQTGPGRDSSQDAPSGRSESSDMWWPQ